MRMQIRVDSHHHKKNQNRGEEGENRSRDYKRAASSIIKRGTLNGRPEKGYMFKVCQYSKTKSSGWARYKIFYKTDKKPGVMTTSRLEIGPERSVAVSKAGPRTLRLSSTALPPPLAPLYMEEAQDREEGRRLGCRVARLQGRGARRQCDHERVRRRSGPDRPSQRLTAKLPSGSLDGPRRRMRKTSPGAAISRLPDPFGRPAYPRAGVRASWY